MHDGEGLLFSTECNVPVLLHHLVTVRFRPLFRQLAPVNSGGIHTVDAPGFSLHCFESPTGVKFFCTSNSRPADAFAFLHKAYELYADYVLKVRGARAPAADPGEAPRPSAPARPPAAAEPVLRD